MSQLDGSEVVDVWIACELSGWDPGRDWVQAAMQRVRAYAPHVLEIRAQLSLLSALQGCTYSSIRSIVRTA